MIENTGCHYLYRHIRLDTGEPFYIGIGTKIKDAFNEKRLLSRAYSKTGRSKFWSRVVSKSIYKVEILLESDDYGFIKQKEIEFIALYGRRDLGKGTLCNLTDGGDGTVNISIETRELKSKKGKGRIVSDETRARQSKSLTGRKMSKEEIERRKPTLRRGENAPTARLLLNLQTGIYYGTLIEAAEAHGLPKKRLSNMLTGWARNTSYLIYAETIDNSIFPIIPEVKPYVEKVPKAVKPPRETKVLDTATGIIYNSIKEAAEKNNLNYKYLRRMINPKGDRTNKTTLVYA